MATRTNKSEKFKPTMINKVINKKIGNLNAKPLKLRSKSKTNVTNVEDLSSDSDTEIKRDNSEHREEHTYNANASVYDDVEEDTEYENTHSENDDEQSPNAENKNSNLEHGEEQPLNVSNSAHGEEQLLNLRDVEIDPNFLDEFANTNADTIDLGFLYNITWSNEMNLN